MECGSVRPLLVVCVSAALAGLASAITFIPEAKVNVLEGPNALQLNPLQSLALGNAGIAADQAAQIGAAFQVQADYIASIRTMNLALRLSKRLAKNSWMYIGTLACTLGRTRQAERFFWLSREAAGPNAHPTNAAEAEAWLRRGSCNPLPLMYAPESAFFDAIAAHAGMEHERRYACISDGNPNIPGSGLGNIPVMIRQTSGIDALRQSWSMEQLFGEAYTGLFALKRHSLSRDTWSAVTLDFYQGATLAELLSLPEATLLDIGRHLHLVLRTLDKLLVRGFKHRAFTLHAFKSKDGTLEGQLVLQDYEFLTSPRTPFGAAGSMQRSRQRERATLRNAHRATCKAPCRDWAHPCHICTGTGLTPATSAPGLGLAPATSAP